MERIIRIMILPAAAFCLLSARYIQHGKIDADSAIPPTLPVSLRADGGYGVSALPQLERFSGAQNYYFNYRLLFAEDSHASGVASPGLAGR